MFLLKYPHHGGIFNDKARLQNRHRADRQTMGHTGAAPAGAESLALGRAKTDPQPSLLRGHPLALAKRCKIQGHAFAFSVRQHLLAATCDVVRAGFVDRHLAKVTWHVGRKIDSQMARMFCGRNLFARKKRGLGVGKTKKGKGTKLMVVADGEGIPLGIQLSSASPHEVKLIESTLAKVRVPKTGRGRPKTKLKRLIYDKAADSDALRLRLKRRGVDLIAPHRDNRVKPPLQDGRKLRRYKRRWKIERTISWIQDFRRLVVRYDREITMFTAFTQIACAMIAIRRL